MVLIFAVSNIWVLWCHRLHMQAPVCTFSVTRYIAFMHGWICLYQNHSKQICPLSGEVNELASTVDLGTLLGIFVVVKPTLITMEDCSMSLIRTSEIPFWLLFFLARCLKNSLL